MRNIREEKQPVILDAASSDLSRLSELAVSKGAGNAKIIPAADIVVENRLADLCVTPGCPNYGHSPSCPPHVSGPSGFRELQQRLPYAVVIRLVVPSSALFSSEKQEVAKFLHELTAAVEAKAGQMGYKNARAFAAGSCKSIFCHDYMECRKLSGGPCRHPESARPSMSGFGINVPELMKRCRWPSDLNHGKTSTVGETMSWLAGLVLVGKAE